MKKYLLFIAIIPFAVGAIVILFYRQTLVYAAVTHSNDLFANYTTWLNAPQSAGFAVQLLGSNASFNTSQATVTPNKFTFTDINGDNLPDFLYHEKPVVSTGAQYYAVFLNNGNNNFNLDFKCVYQSGRAYGDCVSTAPDRDPNAPENQNKLAQVLQLANFTYGAPDIVPFNHLWIDINGDGLQDYIDSCLNINNNATGQFLFSYQKFCS